MIWYSSEGLTQEVIIIKNEWMCQLMKKNKIAIALVGMACAITLGACTPKDEALVTMKGDKITVSEFFDEIKSSQTVQESLQNSIIFRVAENAYGKEVDKKAIDTKLEEVKKQFGETFAEQLKSAGFTEATYKEKVIKPQLAFDKMLDAHVEVKDADLKTVWKTYHPEVETRVASFTDKKEAEKALKEINDGGNIETIAREKSTHTSSKEKGKLTFDSASQELPEDVKTAAFELKDGKVSKLITSEQMDQTGQTISNYYIVKMVKNQDKGKDMNKYKEQLTKIASDTQKADQTFVPAVITEELKKANVKITDKDLQNVLASFVEETTDTSAADKKETKDTKAADKKETKEADKK